MSHCEHLSHTRDLPGCPHRGLLKMAQDFLSRRTLGVGMKLLIVVSSAELFIMLLFQWFHVNNRMSPLLVGLTDFLLLATITSLAIYLLRIDPLQKEREKARLYLDIAGAMILAVDADQRVSLVNRRGCELLGYAEKDIVGKNWFDAFLPGKYKLKGKKEFEKIMSDGVLPDRLTETRVMTHSGEERLISWHMTIVRDDKGAIVGALASGEDITERKQYEVALKMAREHAEAEKAETEAIIAAIGDGITIQDTDFKIVYQNDIMKNVFWGPGRRILLRGLPEERTRFAMVAPWPCLSRTARSTRSERTVRRTTGPDMLKSPPRP